MPKAPWSTFFSFILLRWISKPRTDRHPFFFSPNKPHVHNSCRFRSISNNAPCTWTSPIWASVLLHRAACPCMPRTYIRVLRRSSDRLRSISPRAAVPPPAHGLARRNSPTRDRIDLMLRVRVYQMPLADTNSAFRCFLIASTPPLPIFRWCTLIARRDEQNQPIDLGSSLDQISDASNLTLAILPVTI